MKNKVNEKRYPNKPLTDEQKTSNKEKSKIRVCFLFYGPKHEWTDCKICWDNKSDRYYRADTSNI